MEISNFQENFPASTTYSVILKISPKDFNAVSIYKFINTLFIISHKNKDVLCKSSLLLLYNLPALTPKRTKYLKVY